MAHVAAVEADASLVASMKPLLARFRSLFGAALQIRQPPFVSPFTPQSKPHHNSRPRRGVPRALADIDSNENLLTHRDLPCYPAYHARATVRTTVAHPTGTLLTLRLKTTRPSRHPVESLLDFHLFVTPFDDTRPRRSKGWRSFYFERTWSNLSHFSELGGCAIRVLKLPSQ